jgi:hypothetical protein
LYEIAHPVVAFWKCIEFVYGEDQTVSFGVSGRPARMRVSTVLDTNAEKCRWKRKFCCWKWLATSALLRGYNCPLPQGARIRKTQAGCSSSSVVWEKQKNGLTTGKRNPVGGTTVGRLEERRFDAVRRTETCAVAGGLTRMCRRRMNGQQLVGNKSSKWRSTVL